MLVSFTFKNHGPFLDETTLDMRAVESYKEHPYNLACVNGQKLVRVAEIHGANASGKSQLVDAYRTFRYLVAYSFMDSSSEFRKLGDRYAPFLFAERSRKEKTEYEAVFARDEGTYQYGFSHNESVIVEEWLYFTSSKTHRRSTILERSQGKISFGASVRQECKKYINDIRDNVLALSFMANVQLESDVFSTSFKCVTGITTITSRMCNADVSMMLRDYFRYEFNDEGEKARLIAFLRAVDTGIRDITVESTERNVQVYTQHKGFDGKMYRAPLEIESDGTRKIIALYSRIIAALKRDGGLIVDELDSQLHPNLMRNIVNLFYSAEAKGQLIHTCHTTEFLKTRYARRDQFWLIEKDEAGRSHLYSLAEFKPRNDTSLAIAYLSGRYGAIPDIDEITFEVV